MKQVLQESYVTYHVFATAVVAPERKSEEALGREFNAAILAAVKVLS